MLLSSSLIIISVSFFLKCFFETLNWQVSGPAINGIQIVSKYIILDETKSTNFFYYFEGTRYYPPTERKRRKYKERGGEPEREKDREQEIKIEVGLVFCENFGTWAKIYLHEFFFS